MLISTKGRYALRVMIDLAEHQNGNCIPMKEIAQRQDISQKYLERIMVVLTKAGLVYGVHGKGGGYKLNRSPEEYRVSDILRLLEGSLAPVSCLECNAEPCEKAAECRTLPMWREVSTMLNNYFDSITIADLMRTDSADNYVI